MSLHEWEHGRGKTIYKIDGKQPKNTKIVCAKCGDTLFECYDSEMVFIFCLAYCNVCWDNFKIKPDCNIK